MYVCMYVCVYVCVYVCTEVWFVPTLETVKCIAGFCQAFLCCLGGLEWTQSLHCACVEGVWYQLWRCGASCEDVVPVVRMWYQLWRCGASCEDVVPVVKMWYQLCHSCCPVGVQNHRTPLHICCKRGHSLLALSLLKLKNCTAFKRDKVSWPVNGCVRERSGLEGGWRGGHHYPTISLAVMSGVPRLIVSFFFFGKVSFVLGEANTDAQIVHSCLVSQIIKPCISNDLMFPMKCWLYALLHCTCNAFPGV